MLHAQHIPGQKKSDAELWRAYHVHKDRSAFEALYLRHNERIFYFIYSYAQDYQLSLDILQDTCIKILNLSKELAPDFSVQNFSSWAIEFSKNIIQSRLRKEANRRHILEQKVVPRKQKEQDLHTNMDWEILKDCINEMTSPAYQKILGLVVEGYSTAEIAEQMNIDSKKVADTKYLAKKAFKKLLQEKGIYEDYKDLIR
ncbi:MAG: RNA polymerase sigma factor [Bacteroidota bacterium]